MINESQPSSVSRKGIFLILGVALLLGSLAALGISGRSFWLLWQKEHQPNPKAVPATPAKTPGAIVAEFAQTNDITWFGGGILGLFVSVRLLQAGRKRKTLVEEAEAMVAAKRVEMSDIVPVTAHKAPRRSASKRWSSCNVLQVGAEKRQLWGFAASRGGFALSQQQTVPLVEPLPIKLVAKDWKTLFQPRLNIAWLPVDQVFLRVTQLPVGDFDETLSMVELQLEKLSPLPVTQIVWSIQILPRHVDNLQTVIVIIVERDLVQEFLGQLEGQGYLADQLELPLLDQLQATPISGDGAWIYPGNTAGKLTGLVAWWYGGTLRNLGLLHVPMVDNRDTLLKEQLTQMAWSGELEGWLTSTPRWHLVADERSAVDWQPMFRAWLGQPVEVISPLSQSELAALTARRAAQAEPKANILPVEYSTRYKQQFVDRLWIRGLLAVLGIYAFLVMIYFVGVQIQGYRTGEVNKQVAKLAPDYTNTLQLKAKLEVLQEREALKFASLDCWKYTAEFLPESVTLNSLEFRNGKTLALNGTAPADQRSLITDFNEAMRKATKDGKPFFEKVDPPSQKLLNGSITWYFNAELARSEEPSQ